jgi:putative MATE family efflux protein
VSDKKIFLGFSEGDMKSTGQDDCNQLSCPFFRRVMEKDLTQGNVKKLLIAFALPFLAANLLQALYGATDLFVVGQFNTASATSAVNIGSQIMQIVTSFVIGFSMGSTVIIGKHIGKHNGDKAAKTLGSTIIIFVLCAVILTPLIFFLSPYIILLLQTPQEAIIEAKTYMWICSIGIPFIIAFNVISAILRGMGDSKTPMIIVVVACVVNVGGDFLLTGLCKMGVMGVAVATFAAQAISSIVGIIILIKRKFSFPFNKKNVRLDKAESKDILKIGLPIAMQDTLINISFIILTMIANMRNLACSSAVGVVEKLILFMFLVPSSMLSSISAFTAQNVSAEKPARAVSATKFGMLITFVFGSLMCILSWCCPQILTRIFSKDTAVIAEANEYLKTYSIDCIFVAIVFCLNGYLCGKGQTLITFLHSVVSIFLVRLPVAFFLSNAYPTTMLPMGLASALGSIMSLIVLGLYFMTVHLKTKRNRKTDYCD